MKTPDDQLLARWLDGELSGVDAARFEAMMASDPSLREEAESMRKLSQALRNHVSLEREVPHADFFNSQIQESIAEIQRAEQRTQAVTAGAATGGWLSWLRMPWALAGAAAVIAITVVISRDARPSTQVLSFYTPNPQVQASAFRSEEADATVLVLEGLDSIPAEQEIAGIVIHHSEHIADEGVTRMLDQQGSVLVVMNQQGAQLPVIASR